MLRVTPQRNILIHKTEKKKENEKRVRDSLRDQVLKKMINTKKILCFKKSSSSEEISNKKYRQAGLQYQVRIDLV